jgi:hypothetical protein
MDIDLGMNTDMDMEMDIDMDDRTPSESRRGDPPPHRGGGALRSDPLIPTHHGTLRGRGWCGVSSTVIKVKLSEAIMLLMLPER